MNLIETLDNIKNLAHILPVRITYNFNYEFFIKNEVFLYMGAGLLAGILVANRLTRKPDPRDSYKDKM